MFLRMPAAVNIGFGMQIDVSLEETREALLRLRNSHTSKAHRNGQGGLMRCVVSVMCRSDRTFC